MESAQIFSIVIIAAFSLPLIAFLLYTIFISPEVDTEETFFFCGQSLSGRQLSESFNSSWVVVGAVIVAVMLLGQFYGLHNWWVALTFLYSWFLFSRHTLAIRRHMSHRGKRTLHNFLGTQFRSVGIRRVASLITVVTVTGVIALEFIIGMAIIAALPALPQATSVAIGAGVFLAFIVGLYTVFGGLLAIVRTDVIQWIGIVAGLVAMLLIGFLYFSLDSGAVERLGNINLWAPSGPVDLWPFYLGIAFNQIPVVMADFGTWQRIGASRKEITEKLPRITLWAGIAQTIIWLLLAAMGMTLLMVASPEVG